MVEIGFSHKIPKLNFVSHLKISQGIFRKKFYDQTNQKKWKNSKIGVDFAIKQEIKVFPLFFTFFLVCLVIKWFPTIDSIGYMGCLVGHRMAAFPGLAIDGICCPYYRNVRVQWRCDTPYWTKTCWNVSDPVRIVWINEKIWFFKNSKKIKFQPSKV